MNIINQATIYIVGESKYSLILELNITSMMVLASIYLSVSSSLPSTPNIKPVEMWLLFNLAYPFFVIIVTVLLQVSSIPVLIIVIISVNVRKGFEALEEGNIKRTKSEAWSDKRPRTSAVTGFPVMILRATSKSRLHSLLYHLYLCLLHLNDQ